MRRALVALALVGCSSPVEVLCPTMSEVLEPTSGLTCEEVRPALDYARVLAARDLKDGQRQSLLSALADRARTDPAAARAGVARAAAWLQGLGDPKGFVAAEARATENAAVEHDGGAFPAPQWPVIGDVLHASIAVWETAPDEALSLSEMDIEGLIRLASLCREVQGGTPLRLSIADRVSVYQIIRERFLAASHQQRVAMLSVGPFWPDIHDAWKAAPFDVQQRWIAEAPLPPPMKTDSNGYVAAVMGGDLPSLVVSLHAALGGLRLDGMPRRAPTPGPAPIGIE